MSDPAKQAAARLAVRALKRELRMFDKLAKEGLSLDPEQRRELVELVQEFERRARGLRGDGAEVATVLRLEDRR